MLAIFGLLGLAIAGSAFVGTLPTHSDADEAGNTTPPETDDAPDLLAQFDTPDPELENGDVIVGGDFDDVLGGTGGDDYIAGAGGDDLAFGNDGDDQMHGGDGDDDMSGDAGDDLAFGDLGDDGLSGGDGDDALHGGSGADVILGGGGNDIMAGGYGDDTLIGGAGQDQMQGSDGNDVIDGVTGEVTAQRDYLSGSEGDDRLIGNDGDVMSGGTGADRFEVVSGSVEIMDYSDDDLLVLSYEGELPELTTEISADGITLLANGAAVASLYGLSEFDVSTVQLVAA